MKRHIAIVTGGGSGIGERIAWTLAARGDTVVVNDRSEERATAVAESIAADGGGAFPVIADVADASSVNAMVEKVLSCCGAVDVLVNNAGIAGAGGSIVDQDVDDWQAVIDVNLRGTYLCTRRVGREMLASGGGCIVSIASIVGMGGFVGRTAYGATVARV